MTAEATEWELGTSWECIHICKCACFVIVSKVSDRATDNFRRGKVQDQHSPWNVYCVFYQVFPNTHCLLLFSLNLLQF